MSTTAIRNPTKVTSLRTAHMESPEKSGAGPMSGPGYLARAVALHLAGQREEALKQLQRAVAANEKSAEIYRAMGTSSSSWATSRSPPRVIAHWRN